MLLQGLFVPLSCPFYRDGVSYLRKLEHNVVRYSLSPAAGLIALPPGGEGVGLTDAEAFAFMRTVGETAAKEKVLLAGVEQASVAACLVQAEQAAEAGFDAILLAPPVDWARLIHGRDARELIVFYELVADHSPLPLVLWSDAAPPSLGLPTNLVESLSRHPNILGLVDANLTEERAAELLAGTQTVRREATVTTVFAAVTRRMRQGVAPALSAGAGFVALDALSTGSAVSAATVAVAEAAPALKTRTKAVGFQLVAAGLTADLVPLLQGGVAAAAPLLAACAPQACFEAYAAWKDGDQALAAERAERLRTAEEFLLKLGPAAIKVGCDYNGYFGGLPRQPRLPLTAADRDTVEQVLAAIRN